MAKLAFLGLGVMGAPMAGHLVAAGHDVTVWNRTANKADVWAGTDRGKGRARAASSIAEAVRGVEAVFTCLGDDPDVEAVYAEILPQIARNTLLVDHTTASAELARSLSARASEQGAMFIDAPVSGGEAGAINGKLTIMCGGSDDAFARAEPFMSVYAKQITRIGESGSGQLAKMVNQICIAGVVQGLSEGLAFAAKAGLDEARVIEAISKGAAQSWQMENRWQTMVDGKFDHGFAVDWMRKDLRLALAEARRNGARLPVAALVDQFYADVQAGGGSRHDTSSLITRLTDGDGHGKGGQQDKGD